MENHKFNKLGSLRICKICFRPKLDAYHLDYLDDTDINGTTAPLSPEQIQINGATAPLLVDGISKLSPALDNENLPDCYGHTCPSCNRRYFHNYKCWPNPKLSEVQHCPECFGNANVEINREKDLKQIIDENKLVNTPDVLIAAQIEHESFVYNEYGKLPEDERYVACIEHINKIRARMEIESYHIRATKLVSRKFQEEAQEKLTPEEIEQYRKRASRQKKTELESEKEEKKKSWEKQLKSLLGLVGGNENLAKEQLKIIYQSQGKSIPDGV
jgi:hypothetical protein